MTQDLIRTAPAPTPAHAPAGPAAGAVLVLVAHPQMEHSRVNRALMLAAARAHRDDGAADAADIEVRDLYALHPDYLIDVPAERAALARASLVVWQHPLHWYGMPPLMKLWADEVLGFGWAYGPGGQALQGKALWLVTSTGGPTESYQATGYNRRAFDAFLPPYEQTAQLCGMRFLKPLVIHGAHRLSPGEIDEEARRYGQRLRSWPWREGEAGKEGEGGEAGEANEERKVREEVREEVRENADLARMVPADARPRADARATLSPGERPVRPAGTAGRRQ